MTWKGNCSHNRDGQRCEGGICPACEACDKHDDCHNTEEVRHVAGVTVQEVEP